MKKISENILIVIQSLMDEINTRFKKKNSTEVLFSENEVLNLS